MTLAGEPVVAVRLSEAERAVLGRWYPELGGYAAAVVVVAASDVRDEVASAVERIRDAVNEHHHRELERAIDELLADEADVRLRGEAKRQAVFRQRVVNEHGGYTAAEVADLNGSRARNRYKLARAWRSSERIFGVPFQGHTIYLAFQFDAQGRPLPVIRDVIHALDGWSGWDVAGWFLRSNGLLSNAQPVELLRDMPDRVVRAAAVDGRRGLSPLRHHDRRSTVSV